MAMERLQEAERHLAEASQLLGESRLLFEQEKQNLAETLGVRPEIVTLTAEQITAAHPRAKVTEIFVLPTAEQLIAKETQAWRDFFGEEKEVIEPPKELFDKLAIIKELGWTNNIVPVSFVDHEFIDGEELPGWQTKPHPRFWQIIKEGHLKKDAARMKKGWALLDITPKPDYKNGLQLYPNEPFGDILKGLREQGKIKVPKGYEHVPQISRFALKPATEIERQFMLEFARTLKVDKRNAVNCPYLLVNIIGNRSYPELGEGTTWEWYGDKVSGFVGGDGRLIGGDSVDGGLTCIYCSWSGGRVGSAGFRPLAILSSSKT